MKEVDILMTDIIEILKNTSEDKIPDSNIKPKTNLNSALIIKFFEAGQILIQSNTIPEKANQHLNDKIVEEIANNSANIRKFLVNFPYIYLTELYAPTTSCKLRSGIQFLFDFWGESLWEQKKIKDLIDPLGRGIPLIDKNLSKWLIEPDNWEIGKQENIPDSHWWFQPVVRKEATKKNIQLELKLLKLKEI